MTTESDKVSWLSERNVRVRLPGDA